MPRTAVLTAMLLIPGLASAGPMFSDWAYGTSVQLANPSPAPPWAPGGVFSQNLSWPTGPGQPTSGTVVKAAGMPAVNTAYNTQYTALPDGVFMAYVGYVTTYTTAELSQTSTYRASGSGRLQFDFTLSDQRGHESATSFAGTLTNSFDGGTAIGSAFVFDGPDPGRAHRSLVVGGIDYEVDFFYGTAPGREGQNGFVRKLGPGPDREGFAGDFYALVTPSSNLPEPGTLALAGVGGGVLLIGRLRRLRRR